jgi:ribose transport system ATP-binding protein
VPDTAAAAGLGLHGHLIRDPASEPLLSVRSLSKWFGATRALSDVSLDVQAGEILALVGANGSGKSTLIRILSGVTRPDMGEVSGSVDYVSGRPAVGSVHQVLGLFDEGTVVENICAVQQGAILHSASEHAAAREILSQVGAHIALDRKVADLPVDQKALVAVARALFAMRDARRAVLVVDEVTSVLRGAAGHRFVSALHRLRGFGVGIVFVSHELDEVLGLADRIVVLRDGAVCAEARPQEMRREQLIELMTGVLSEGSPVRNDRTRAGGLPVLRVDHLHGATVVDVSFELRAGEIVGLTGVTGSGYDDIPYLIAGTTRPRFGSVTLDGHAVSTPHELAQRGGRFIPADRNHRALSPAGSVLENYLFDHKCGVSRFGLTRRRRERLLVEQALRTYGVKCDSIDSPVTSLSGGNQQKLVLARCIDAAPRLLVVHEPTQGVDVHARADLLALLRGAVERLGVAVLYACADLEELWQNCHRVIVVRRGRIMGEVVPGVDQIAVAHGLMY